LPQTTRRDFLLCWFPFFRRRSRTLAGIRFENLRRGRSSRRYLLIHGDEHTARQLLVSHMKAGPGLAHLVTGRERLVTVGGARIDPNRLFSRTGAERSLRRLNPDMAPERLYQILDRLDRERPGLVRALLPPRGGLLVALHNNSGGYSVRDEIPLSDETALNDPSHPHDFMLATGPEDFARLARSPFNTVLQHRRPEFDDGSLSRLCARLRVRYVNIEAALGALPKQAAMLSWLTQHLP